MATSRARDFGSIRKRRATANATAVGLHETIDTSTATGATDFPRDEAPQTHTARIEIGDDLQQMRQRAAEAVESPDDEGVAALQIG